MSQENVAGLSHPRRARVPRKEYPPLGIGTGVGQPASSMRPPTDGRTTWHDGSRSPGRSRSQ
jgi:hypothetical protein